MKRDNDDLAPKTFAAQREREVGARVRSLFRHCERSDNPVLVYSRACSKVGYLARDGERTELLYLESALNERKQALVMERWGKFEQAVEHNLSCGHNLRAFHRAIRTELGRVRPLREREPEAAARGVGHQLRAGTSPLECANEAQRTLSVRATRGLER